jgi:hypothetical protein
MAARNKLDASLCMGQVELQVAGGSFRIGDGQGGWRRREGVW